MYHLIFQTYCPVHPRLSVPLLIKNNDKDTKKANSNLASANDSIMYYSQTDTLLTLSNYHMNLP